MSIEEAEEVRKSLEGFIPVLMVDFDYDNWYFLPPDGRDLVGPYKTWQRAIEKYHEYCAYTVDAPGCHCHVIDNTSSL